MDSTAPAWTLLDSTGSEPSEPTPGDESAFVERLATTGALAEAERVWDEIDAGTFVCEGEPAAEVMAEARRRAGR